MVVLLVPLAVVLTLFVAYANSYLQHSSSHGVVGWLAKVVSKAAWVGEPIAKEILRLDAYILHAIGSHFKAIEQRGVGWLTGLSLYQKIMAATTLVWPSWLWAASVWIVHRAIPRGVKAQTAPIAKQAAHADATATIALRGVQDLAHAKPGTNTQVRITRIERVAMPHAAEWDWITNHWRAVEHAALTAYAPATTLPRPIAKALPWPFGVTPKQLFRRFRRVEALLGVTGFALIMARVLRIPNPRCLSTGPIGKFARALCGAPSHLINDLLGLLADVWIVENVCTLIPLLETAASDVAVPVVKALTVVGAGLCDSNEKPKALQGPKPVAPPVYFGTAAVGA